MPSPYLPKAETASQFPRSSGRYLRQPWVSVAVALGALLQLPCFGGTAFYFEKIDVSGGKAASNGNGELKPGGRGGTVDIRTGVELEAWKETGPDAGGQLELHAGVYRYRQVVSYKEGVATMIYVAGDVTIYCQHRFAPTRILRLPGYQGPVSLTVYAGTPLEFDEGGTVGQLRYHSVDSEVLLSGRAGATSSAQDSDAFASGAQGMGLEGGRFTFWTSFPGDIGSDRAARLDSVLASGGAGADGGDGGAGGDITLVATAGDVLADIVANGGAGGSNRNAPASGEGYDYHGPLDGGDGGDGGSVSLRARTVFYDALRGWRQIKAVVDGGGGGGGRPQPVTPKKFGESGRDGGDGGHGGHGGTVVCRFEKPVLDPTAFSLSLRGGGGGSGGSAVTWNGGHGAGGEALGGCRAEDDAVPGDGGAGGSGGRGGFPGRVAGDVPPAAIQVLGGYGGSGGRGGNAGGPVYQGAYPDRTCVVGTGGDGGRGGDSGSLHASVKPGAGGQPGMGHWGLIFDLCFDCEDELVPGERGKDGQPREGETTVSLREPPSGTEPVVTVEILDAKPRFYTPLMPSLPFDMARFDTRAAVFLATRELSQGGRSTPGGTALGRTLPERTGLVADGTTKLLVVCEASVPGNLTVRHPEARDAEVNVQGARLSFSWTDDEERPAVGIPTWSLEEQPLLGGRPRHAAYAVITAPDYIPSEEKEEELEVEVVFTPTGGGSVTNRVSLTLTQPPVLLVHGLWADPNLFLTQNPGLIRHLVDGGMRVRVADYARSNAAPFAANQGVVGAEIRGLQETLEKEGTAVTQVNVVAHSMGGILTRYHGMRPDYAGPDNFGRGDVRRLITLDTPHFGARTAEFLANLDRECPSLSGALWKSVDVFTHSRLRRGPALDDLVPGSSALRRIAGSPFPGKAIAGMSLTSETYGLDLAWATLRTLDDIQIGLCRLPLAPCAPCLRELQARHGYRIVGGTVRDFIASIFKGEANDRVVELSSQLGGLGERTSFTVEGVNHSSVVGTPLVTATVLEALLSPPALLAPSFPGVGGAGLAALESSASSKAPREEWEGRHAELPAGGASSVSILQPLEGASVAAGSLIELRLAASSEVGAAVVLAETPKSFEVFSVTNWALATSWTAPADVVGDYSIRVIPILTNGEAGEPAIRTVRVTTSLSVTALSSDRGSLAFEDIGQEETLQILGTFSDGSRREIRSGSLGLQYSVSPTGVVAVAGTGRVTSLAAGTATLTVRYQSKAVSVPIAVVPQAPVVSAVEVTSAGDREYQLRIEGLRLGGVTTLRVLDLPSGGLVEGVEVRALAGAPGGRELTATLRLPGGVRGPLGVQVGGAGGGSSPFVGSSARWSPPEQGGPRLLWVVTPSELVLSWTAVEPWTLESSAALGPAARWEAYAGPVTADGARQEARVPWSTGMRFYRLRP